MSDELEPQIEFDNSFVKTAETENYTPDKTTSTDWEAVRDECVSGGAMTDDCNIIFANENGGALDVVAKRLSCGCILVRTDHYELM